jgi:hypothetical protein
MTKATDPSQSYDIEAPPIASAPPVYAIPIADEPQPTYYRSTPATVIYVRENANRDHAMVDNQEAPDPNPSMLPCAIVGCIFSWIPLIGIITFLVNMNAPRNTRRRLFAHSACCIATFIIIFNLLFWPSW